MMFHSKILRLGSLTTVAVGLVSTLYAGPLGTSGTLYLTAADQKTGIIVQGTTATTFALSGNMESPIAVFNGSISTEGYVNMATGSTYDLNGNLISGGVNSAAISGFYTDGTTDGLSNYVVDFNSGKVYGTSTSWTSPSVLFTAAGSNPLGITYDANDGTLWISDYSDTTVNEYTVGGSLVSSFSTGHTGNTALAYDQSDNTLWLVNAFSNTPLQLEQYSLTGSNLQTLNFSSLSGNNVLGGEFAATPEPGTLLIGGIGLAMLGLSRFRRAARKA